MPENGTYVERLVSIANGELENFGGINENDEPLRARIDAYCEEIGETPPDDISSFAWSAVFVSWCVKTAGATRDEFKFANRHAIFAQAAIRNADAGTGVFLGRRIDAHAPKVGDIIQWNREGGRVTYDRARTRNNYPSHSAIVVALTEQGGERFALTVGGNEGNSVGTTRVKLDPSGRVRQRESNPFICVIENRKTDGPVGAAVRGRRRGVGAAPLAGPVMAPSGPIIARRAEAGRKRVHGPIIEALQTSLAAAGFPVGVIDGDFGNGTERALKQWQRSKGLAETGVVTTSEWTALTGLAAPSIFDLCLQLTASYEGTGFTGAVGNFDGAGITFGIIGFTARHGELGELLTKARARDAAIVARAFGSLANDLLEAMEGNEASRVAFGDEISMPGRKYNLRPEWREAFKRFGSEGIVKALQIERAYDVYWQKARGLFERYRLGEARDASLLYDVAVQNGGVKASANAEIQSRLPGAATPEERRLIIAEAVRDASNPRWQADVFSRKSAIATGEGLVHGARYDLLDWGLAHQPASAADMSASTSLNLAPAGPVGAMRVGRAGALRAGAGVGPRSYYPHWVWRRGDLPGELLARLPEGAIIGCHHSWTPAEIEKVLAFPGKGFQVSWYVESNTQETDGEQPGDVGKPIKTRIEEARSKQDRLAARFGAERFANLIELDAARDKADGHLNGPGNARAHFLRDARAVEANGFKYLAKNLAIEHVDRLRSEIGRKFVPRVVIEDVTATEADDNKGYREDAKALAARADEVLTLVVHQGEHGDFRGTTLDEAREVVMSDFAGPNIEVYYGHDEPVDDGFVLLKGLGASPVTTIAAARPVEPAGSGDFASRAAMLAVAFSRSSRPSAMVNGQRRLLNAAPDTPDLRDHMYVPALIDVEDRLAPPRELVILDQGQEGACTGFALAASVNRLIAIRHQRARQRGASGRVSPRMLYEMARLHDEWPGENYAGSSIRGAMKGFFHNGVCSDQLAPYKTHDPGWTLTIEQARSARGTTLGAYYRLKPDATHYHVALNEVGIICASARVHEGWRAPRGGRIVSSRSHIGGHAFAIVGYDDKGFLVQNSWGPRWGGGGGLPAGVAHWSYEDWAENVLDAWVMRLAAPTPEAFDHVRSRSSFSIVAVPGPTREGDDNGEAVSFEPPRREEVIGHVININDGVLQEKGGRYATPLPSLVDTAKHLANPPAGKPRYEHVMIYAHGGLNSLDDGAKRAAALREPFKRNGIYPIFLLWGTDFTGELSDVLRNGFRRVNERVGGFTDFTDRAFELLVGKVGRAIWREMKRDAELAFGRDSDKSNGLTALREMIGHMSARNDGGPKIHLVGHSAGSLLLGRMLSGFAAGSIGQKLESLQLLAPACTLSFHESQLVPALGRSGAGGIKSLDIYNLTDGRERADATLKVYRKSLLYLVSNALEEEPDQGGSTLGSTPLLGMERFAGRVAKPGGMQLFYSGRDSATDSKDHGDFDNDLATMTSVMTRILGRPPAPDKALTRNELQGY